MTNFVQLTLSGGWVLLALGLCSALASYIVIERMFYLKQDNVIPQGVLNQVQNLFTMDRLDEEQLMVLEKASIFGSLLATIYRNSQVGFEELKEMTEIQGRQCAQKLSKNIDYLQIIASVSPLLGVLGTILGMMDIFGVLTNSQELSNQQQMAHGISQALITTAYGIAVAVPCHFAHRWLSGKVQHLTLRLEEESMASLTWVKNN